MIRFLEVPHVRTKTVEEHKALLRRWFEEVWNKGRADAIAEMMAEDAVAHGLSDDAAKPLRGPKGFLPFHAQFREAFPLGFKATQAPVEFTGMVITRIKDGKIAEAWNNFDFMKMYRQLGAI